MSDAFSFETRMLEVVRRAGGPVLAVDASGPVTSVCAAGWRSGQVRELRLAGPSLPSESLMPALVSLFEACGMTAADLKAVVVGIGPGSFTGLRVGLATVKGLCFGAKVPLLGVSSLGIAALSGWEVLGEGRAAAGDVVAVLDGRRGDLFSSVVRVEAGAASVRWLAEDRVRRGEGLAEHLTVEVCGGVGLGTASGTNDGVAASGMPDCERLPWVCDGEMRDATEACAGRPVVGVGLRAGWGLVLAQEALRAEHLAQMDARDSVMGLVPAYLQLSEPERKLRDGLLGVKG